MEIVVCVSECFREVSFGKFITFCVILGVSIEGGRITTRGFFWLIGFLTETLFNSDGKNKP